MQLSKLAVTVLALAPVAANAATAKLLCASSNGSTEVRLVTADPGYVKIFTANVSFTVDAKVVAPLFTGHPEKMNGVTVAAKDVPGLALTFDNIGEGDYGHPILHTLLKIDQGNGKVAGGVLGQCSLATRIGY